MEKVNQGMRKVFTLASALFVFGVYGENGVTVQMGADRDASLSCTVLDARYAEPSKCDIATSLLLDSDIKGDAEDPQWYFSEDRTGKQHQGLEALLLTQGWSRYDMPASLSGTKQEPQAPIEIGPEIMGRVKTQFLARPVGNAQINILAPQLGMGDLVYSNSAGWFCFDGFDYPENTPLLFQVLNEEGKNEANFVLEKQEFPSITPFTPRKSEWGTSSTIDDSKVKRLLTEDGRMSVVLSEVVVRNRERVPASVYDWLAGRTLTRGDMKRKNIKNIEQALWTMPGFTLSDGVVFRGGKAVEIWVGDRPWRTEIAGAVEVDGSRDYSVNRFESMYPFDNIERIDYFYPNCCQIFGPSAAMAGGVLLFTLKDGKSLPHDKDFRYQTIVPLGYQKKVERYTPKYDIMDDAVPEVFRTLYWIPRAEFGADGRLSLPIPPAVSEAYVVVEGLKPDGTPVSYSEKIRR